MNIGVVYKDSEAVHKNTGLFKQNFSAFDAISVAFDAISFAFHESLWLVFIDLDVIMNMASFIKIPRPFIRILAQSNRI